ncbi:methyltransferase [Amycolatopsis sp. A133]|uniref:methyltransferase n=1 Tax=Amycolatopsis sp. A133 TaxID=3064472 RepID=UPI0027FD48C6|nr:methyltransferase [Amycolatopsis sp. A133]MDQ7803470.1 methyltransferase [Amycolatopsis sp. A133]
MAGKTTPADAAARGAWLARTTAAGVRRPTTFHLYGREWDLLPGVFSPVHCVSTRFFTDSLPFPADGTFLEVGCGAGVTSVRAALAGTRVTATDISAAAVENTTMNVHRHGVADLVTVVHGDMFDGIRREERFDVIFWNSPFIDPPEAMLPDVDERLRRAVFDPGYRAHAGFLSGARQWLTPSGRLLLGFSDLGDHTALDRLAGRVGYRKRQLRTSGRLVAGVEFQLLELVPADQAGQ